MQEENKKYTAKDFENYYDGSMPPKEMHALEKAALEDPFLADALEGYTYTSDFQGDITDLKNRLEERKKRRGLFSISSISQNAWWRIAALFIVIAGAGFLFYRINLNHQDNTLATMQAPALQKKPDSVAALADSAAAAGDVALQSFPSPDTPQKNEITSSKKKEPASEFESTKKGNETKPSTGKDAESDVAIANDENINADKRAAPQSREQYLLKGKVTDEKGQPIAMASVNDDARKRSAVTDTLGNFVLPAGDSNLTATVSAAGYDSKKTMLQKDKEPTIAMNKADADLSEVAVSGYGVEKKKEKALSRENALSGKVVGVEITNAMKPFPKNERFDQYISDNMQPVIDADGKRLTGEVVLSFSVNQKGKPTNIKVQKSTCEPCKEQAIRLLQDGPEWENYNQKTGTVTIKF